MSYIYFIDKNQTPCHIFIVFVFGQFGIVFYNFEFGSNSAVIIICLILILFFSLVFNEIIELRFCKLAYNTKKNIAERAEGDKLIANDNIERSDTLIEMPDFVLN